MAKEQMTLETITPHKAQEYLGTLRLNRKVRMRHLDALTTAITNGQWQVNGESIKFNIAGQLIDGQHRLHAVINANTSINTYVIRELPEDSIETIDTGLKRSPGDILGLQGFSDATNLAASARWIWRYETKQMEMYRVNPSIETLRTVIEAHPDLKNSLSYGTLTRKLITRSLGSALHCLMSERASFETEQFFAKLKDGDNLQRGAAIYLLRNRLIANSQAKARLPDYELAALTIKAFNLYCSGQKVAILRWAREGKRSEPFPLITKEA